MGYSVENKPASSLILSFLEHLYICVVRQVVNRWQLDPKTEKVPSRLSPGLSMYVDKLLSKHNKCVIYYGCSTFLHLNVIHS